MPYSEEDAIIIKHYRQTYNWGSRKILSQLGSGKKWTRDGIEYIIQRVDETGSHKGREVDGLVRAHGLFQTFENVSRPLWTIICVHSLKYKKMNKIHDYLTSVFVQIEYDTFLIGVFHFAG